MSFPRYEKYKDSGVEWLGEVPEHWEALALKRLLECKITDGPHSTPEFIDEGVPFLSVDGIQDGELVFEGCRFVSQADHLEFSKKCKPTRDDLLMGKAASTGKIARVKTDMEFSVWSPLALIRVKRNDANASFIEYSLKSALSQAQIDVLCTSNTQKNISMDDIPRLVLACPPDDEQSTIAAFLDHETAKIDALVEEQRRLIELLKEKRQAVISHAVTKGLNPDAPMKDSGVEWLGEVPEHWEVVQLKWFTTLQRGHDLTNDERTDGPYPVVTSGGVSGTHDEYKATGPGVVTGRYGSTGQLYFIEENYWPHNTSLYVSDFHDNDPRYAWYALQSVDFAAHSAKSAVPGIDRNDIHVLPSVVPPVDEQRAIVGHLDQTTMRIDALVSEAKSVINLIQERRTALISAAVTGKIDVREHK